MDEVWFCFSLSPTRSHCRSVTCAGPAFAYNKENVFGLTTHSATRTALVTELLIHVKWSMAFNWKVHGLIWISCLPACSAFPRSEIVLWNLLQLFGSRALNCSAILLRSPSSFRFSCLLARRSTAEKARRQASAMRALAGLGSRDLMKNASPSFASLFIVN